MLHDLAREQNKILTRQILGHDDHAVITAARDSRQPTAMQMRYDGTDWSEWQWTDPVWSSMHSLQMLVTRLCDGSYYDPTFVGGWDGMQSMPAPYKGFYALPNPDLGWKAQGDYIKSFFDRADTPFGAAGHFYSIDDESTTRHGQFTDSGMRSLRSYLEDIFQKEELHYVGAYSGNYGFIENEGWQLWLPWPIGNGSLPTWTTNFTAWQWGVAGKGEVPGFPTSSVDVNMIMDTSVMNRLSGRTSKTGLTMADVDAIMARLTDIIGYLGNQESTRQLEHSETIAKANAIQTYLGNQESTRQLEYADLLKAIQSTGSGVTEDQLKAAIKAVLANAKISTD